MPVSIYATTPRIVTSAHGINRGVIPNLSKPEGESDFYFMQADDPATGGPADHCIGEDAHPEALRARCRP